MSIAGRQARRALNSIIQKALQSGYRPTVKWLMKKLSDYFDKHPIGYPTMQLRRAEYKSKSNPESWNKTVDEIHEDLTVLYEENIDQVERMLINFDYTETEKRKLEHRLKYMEDNMKELLLLNSNDIYLYSFVESFTDLIHTDLKNTNAYVDLVAGEVIPMRTATGNKKADLSGAHIKEELLTKSGIVSSTTIQPIQNALDDTYNTAWLHKVVSSAIQEVKYRITLMLDESVESTRIQVNQHNTNIMKVMLRITEDGKTWRVVHEQVTSGPIIADFSLSRLQGLEITMSKSESDGREPGGEVYYFGLSSIEVIKFTYEDYNYYQSLPITIKDRNGNQVDITKLALEVDHAVTPPSNWINYYVALEPNPEEPTEWMSITPMNLPEATDTQIRPNQPPKVIDFRIMATESPKIYPVEEPTHYGTFNGLYVWSIGQAPVSRVVLNNTLAVYQGHQQWRRESYIYQWEDENHIPTGEDWASLPTGVHVNSINTNYIDMPVSANTSIVANTASSNYRWTTNIKMQKQVDVKAKIRLSSTGYVTIYVNNSEIIDTKGKELYAGAEYSISFTLVNGWNTIQILYYNRSTSNNTTIDLVDFNPVQISSDVLADIRQMEVVPEFDLCYNVKELETRYIALSKDNQFLINNEMRDQGAKYRISYSYRPDTNKRKVLIKAELYKDPTTTLPPKIRQYKLRVIT